MKTFAFAALATSVLSAGLVGLAAPALAAPSGAGNASDTISSLEDEGYRVIINRMSNAPLDEADVVSVGEGPTFARTDTNNGSREGYTGYDRQFAPDNQRTVYVNVR